MNMYRQKRRVYLLWDYFLKTPDDKKGTCKLCNNVLSYKSSITNLKTHLKSKHRHEYSEYMAKVNKEVDLTSALALNPEFGSSSAISRCSDAGEALDDKLEEFEVMKLEAFDVNMEEEFGVKHEPASPLPPPLPPTPGTSSAPAEPEPQEPPRKSSKSSGLEFCQDKLLPEQNKAIEESLINLIIKSYLPLSLVQDLPFAQFVKSLNPLYVMPTKNFLSLSKIPILFLKCQRDNQKILIEKAKSLSLTIECWTSISSAQYMAVAAHFIQEDIRPVSVMLRCIHLGDAETSDPRTGLAITLELEKIIKDWYISDKLKFVVSDSSVSIPKAVGIQSWENLSCYANSLNDVVTESIVMFNDVIKKVKTVVDHILKNCEVMDLLLEHQLQIEKERMPKRLKTCDLSKWDSIYKMLKRFSEMETALTANIPCIDEELPLINNDDWSAIRQFCIVLQPFEEVIRSVSTEGYLAGSMVIALTNGIMSVISNIKKNEKYCDRVTAIIDTLEQRMTRTFSEIESNETLALCTLLDPRFKEFAFSNKTAAESTKCTLVNIVQQYMVSNGEDEDRTGQQEEDDENKFSVWRGLQERIAAAAGERSAAVRAAREVDAYCKEPLLARERCPLAWWRTRRHTYPGVCEVFVRHCHVPATAAPCSQLFTERGRLLEWRRARLPAQHVEKLVILHGNSSQPPSRPPASLSTDPET